MNPALGFFLGVSLSLTTHHAVAEGVSDEADNAVIPCKAAVAAVDKIVGKILATQSVDVQNAYSQSIIFISESTQTCTEVEKRKSEAEANLARSKAPPTEGLANSIGTLCPTGRCIIDITEVNGTGVVNGNQVPDLERKINETSNSLNEMKNTLKQQNSLQKSLSRETMLQQGH
jgi:hypothetical protein